jgi:hypothetical protein
MKPIGGLFALFTLLQCHPAVQTSPTMPEPAATVALPEHYTGSFYLDNYVWGGAMNLCWTELSRALIGGPIALNTADPAALQTADRLNHPVCSRADLDAPSYYVKAGYGRTTLEQINRECREKFPDKSFSDLDFPLGEQDIISYAYFLKKVQYEIAFSKQPVLFEGKTVSGFGARDKQKQGVEILEYQDDQHFILRLRLKDPSDELLLAKGYDTRHPKALLAALAPLSDKKAVPLGNQDQFQMPELHLNFRRDYTEMTGKSFKNNGFEGYFIAQMFENIAFDLDETGARVENEAVIVAPRSAAPPQHRRLLYLDQPFWVLMKRHDSPNPYFLLGVSNTNFMKTP